MSTNLNLLAELKVIQRAAASEENVKPSQDLKDFVADLIYREKTVGLSCEETALLNQLMQVEHRMRLVKLRSRLRALGK